MIKSANTISKIGAPGTAILFLLAFIAISLWLIIQYVDKERQRDLMNWQSRLSLLAEIRAAAVEDELMQRKNQLLELANNPTLRLFLSQYADKDTITSAIIRAQQGHVRNLLSATAERLDLVNRNNQGVNLNQESDYGLALYDASRDLLMSSKGFPVDAAELHGSLVDDVYMTSGVVLIDIYKSQRQSPVFGFIAPVMHIQGGDVVGAVMILLDPAKSLYPLLENRQSATSSDESLLVMQKGASIQYISPLSGNRELFHQLPDNNNSLASSYAYHHVGDFTEMVDYQGRGVLVTGRAITGSRWVLVQKIVADEALAESNRHQKFLLTTFSVLVLFIATAFIAVWRHSTSVRLQKLSKELETHTALLDAVTENIQDNILLVDRDERLLFINPSFLKSLALTAEDAIGQKLANVLGQGVASELAIIEPGKVQAKCLDINGMERSYHVTSTSPASGEHAQAKLYVLHDISELKQAQQKREALAKGIISTLVKAVDLHDPFCANHSERTREVAVEIAREMGLEEERVETLEMAALLANIGKLFIPKDILTKLEALSKEESSELKKHIGYAVDILSDLSFNGPVLEVIAQKNERIDGSGYPAGLSGEQLLPESRILAVANTFVAMASSRAYRQGLPVKDVVDALLKQTDQKYDRHVVAALFHIAENKSDWDKWQDVSETVI